MQLDGASATLLRLPLAAWRSHAAGIPRSESKFPLFMRKPAEATSVFVVIAPPAMLVRFFRRGWIGELGAERRLTRILAWLRSRH